MAYFNTCPNCGSNLDPGEKCDCRSMERKRQEIMAQMLKESPVTGQFEFRFTGMLASK